MEVIISYNVYMKYSSLETDEYLTKKKYKSAQLKNETLWSISTTVHSWKTKGIIKKMCRRILEDIDELKRQQNDYSSSFRISIVSLVVKSMVEIPLRDIYELEKNGVSIVLSVFSWGIDEKKAYRLLEKGGERIFLYHCLLLDKYNPKLPTPTINDHWSYKTSKQVLSITMEMQSNAFPDTFDFVLNKINELNLKYLSTTLYYYSSWAENGIEFSEKMLKQLLSITRILTVKIENYGLVPLN